MYWYMYCHACLHLVGSLVAVKKMSNFTNMWSDEARGAEEEGTVAIEVPTF